MSTEKNLNDLSPFWFLVAAHILVYTLDAGFLLVWHISKNLYHWLF